jgi:hypothetical protein
VWVPAAYPDEPPTVDGFTLKSFTSANLLSVVCEALRTELVGSQPAERIPTNAMEHEPEPEPEPELEPEPD